MLYITAIILAVCISINSLAGTVGMLVLCLHENFAHVNFNARHFCCQSAGYLEFEANASKNTTESCFKCLDILIESKNPQNAPVHTLKIPPLKIFSHPIPPEKPRIILVENRFEEFLRHHLEPSVCGRTRNDIPLTI